MKDRTKYFEQQMSEMETAKKSPLRNYIRLLSFVSQNQFGLLASYILCCVIQGGLSPVATMMWKRYIDLAGGVGRSHIPMQIVATLLFFVFIMLLQSAFALILENLAAKFNFSSWNLLDLEIGKKAAAIHAEYHELPAICTVIERAWYFTRAGYVLLFQLGLTVFSSLSATVGLLISLFWIEPWLFIIGGLTLVPALIHKYLIAYEEAVSRKADSKEALQYRYFKNVSFDKTSFREMALDNRFDFFNEKLRNAKYKIVEIRRKLSCKKIAYQLSEDVVRNILLILCILITVLEIIHGKASIGSFSAVFLLINNLMGSMQELVQQIFSIINSSYSIQEFYKFLDLEANPEVCEGQEDAGKDVGTEADITFHDVSFRYPMANILALENLTVKVKKGEHIAIVGANGSGKSTFAKLMMGLLVPSYGTICYQGENIENLDEREYQALFSPVFQDFNKYKDTLFYNVFIADVTKKEETEQIKKSLKLAGFDKEVEEETLLSGEFGGIELSGGEWQKVAMARAIFSDKDIIILDEPTAAIDPIRESAMYRNFAEMYKGKTTFFITHRLGSVLLADKIMFFENGKLEEYGTHDELLKQAGKYEKFWKAQTEQYQI